tara:strand:+ start:190 stop:594 length:405 start_codon:yes stop_codon:yes gene_type:complete
MSSIKINFSIASENPLLLANFYAQFNALEVSEGFGSSHFFISLNNECKIQFYKPSSKRSWPTKGSVTSLLFQKKPCKNTMLCLEQWMSALILLGAKVVEEPREEPFGSEVWMKDPEDNQFLILVPNNFAPHYFL